MDSSREGETKNDSRWPNWRWLGWCAALLLAACWPLLFWRYGLDLTDSGWYAVMSRDFFSRPDMVATAAPWYLTWAIGACLTAHSGDNGWLMLRLCGFLPYALSTAAVAALALRLKAPLVGSGIGILCASVLSYSCGSIGSINYATLSAAFCCVGLCAILIACFSRSGPWAAVLVILGGVCFALAAASRINSILCVIPAWFCLHVADSGGNRWKRGMELLIGLAGGVLLVAVFAAWAGNLAALTAGLHAFLLGSVGTADATSHPAAYLVRLWVRSFVQACGLAACVTLLLGLLRHVLLGRIAVFRVLCAVILAAMAAARGRYPALHNAMPLIVLGVACLELNLNPALRLSRAIPCTIATGFMFAAVFSMGSTGGYGVSLFACWIALPFLPQLVSDKTARKVIVFALAMMIAAGARTSFSPVRDKKIGDLRCRIASGVLTGVFSQCDRIAEVEGVVDAIDRYSQPGDAVFIAQNSPGLYVLARRQVWGAAPWPYLRPAAGMAQMFQRTPAPPKLFVLERRDVANSDWPGGQAVEPAEHISGEKKHWPVYLDYLGAHRYAQVYVNSMWVVYRCPGD